MRTSNPPNFATANTGDQPAATARVPPRLPPTRRLVDALSSIAFAIQIEPLDAKAQEYTDIQTVLLENLMPSSSTWTKALNALRMHAFNGNASYEVELSVHHALLTVLGDESVQQNPRLRSWIEIIEKAASHIERRIARAKGADSDESNTLRQDTESLGQQSPSLNQGAGSTLRAAVTDRAALSDETPANAPPRDQQQVGQQGNAILLDDDPDDDDDSDGDSDTDDDKEAANVKAPASKAAKKKGLLSLAELIGAPARDPPRGSRARFSEKDVVQYAGEDLLQFFKRFALRLSDAAVPLRDWFRFFDKAISQDKDLSADFWLLRETYPDKELAEIVQLLADASDGKSYEDLKRKERRMVQRRGESAQDFRKVYSQFWTKAAKVGIKAPAEGFSKDFISRLQNSSVVLRHYELLGTVPDLLPPIAKLADQLAKESTPSRANKAFKPMKGRPSRPADSTKKEGNKAFKPAYKSPQHRKPRPTPTCLVCGTGHWTEGCEKAKSLLSSKADNSKPAVNTVQPGKLPKVSTSILKEDGSIFQVRALVDTGCEVSCLVAERVIQRAGLEREVEAYSTQLHGVATNLHISGRIALTLVLPAPPGSIQVQVEALLVPDGGEDMILGTSAGIDVVNFSTGEVYFRHESAVNAASQHSQEALFDLAKKTLDEFPELLSDIDRPSTLPPVSLRLKDENAKPFHVPRYRQSIEDEKIIDNEISLLLKLGVIEPSKTPWTSPIIVARGTKPRVVVDSGVSMICCLPPISQYHLSKKFSCSSPGLERRCSVS